MNTPILTPVAPTERELRDLCLFVGIGMAALANEHTVPDETVEQWRAFVARLLPLAATNFDDSIVNCVDRVMAYMNKMVQDV